jgi:hypothetical protein
MDEMNRSQRAHMFNLILGAGVVALAFVAFSQNVALRRHEQRLQELTTAVANKTQVQVLDLQERCAQHAKNAFGTLGQNGDLALYASHFNAKLGRCFVEIESHDTRTSPGTMFVNKTLMDSVEGFVYGDYAAKSLDPTPLTCAMKPSRGVEQTCKSLAEFDDFVKRYMEDH